MQKFISGNATLAVEAKGRGAPVVFLHAAVADSRMWRSQIAGLASGYRSIAYDRRGFGATSAALEHHSSVEDLMAVIRHFAGGRPAVLVGCSQGGRVALDASLRYPDMVEGLVLIAPNVSGAPEPVYPMEVTSLMAQIRNAEASGDLDRVNLLKARVVLDGALASAGRVGADARALFLDMNAQVLRAPPVGRDLDDEMAYRRLSEIAVRSAVAWGDLDFPHVQDRSLHLAETMPNCARHVFSGAAHLPSLERPAEVTGFVNAFLTA